MKTIKDVMDLADEHMVSILGFEQQWRKLRNQCDRGSYCESASEEYRAALKIEEAFGAVLDAMKEAARK